MNDYLKTYAIVGTITCGALYLIKMYNGTDYATETLTNLTKNYTEEEYIQANNIYWYRFRHLHAISLYSSMTAGLLWPITYLNMVRHFIFNRELFYDTFKSKNLV